MLILVLVGYFGIVVRYFIGHFFAPFWQARANYY
jgi:hypothetical protein